VTFIERLDSGAVQTTTIMKGGASVHSRHTMLLDKEIMPSQFYGQCKSARVPAAHGKTRGIAMKLITIAALALSTTTALAQPLPALSQPVTCQVSAKFSCAAETGCRENRLGVWNVIDMQGQTYARCDSRGCDKYDARLSRSGVFIIIDVPGHGMMAKLAADMSAFLEVATIGTQALVSFGTCQMR
jgi:hypothetical protein